VEHAAPVPVETSCARFRPLGYRAEYAEVGADSVHIQYEYCINYSLVHSSIAKTLNSNSLFAVAGS
jgi:hypothetical protein